MFWAKTGIPFRKTRVFFSFWWPTFEATRRETQSFLTVSGGSRRHKGSSSAPLAPPIRPEHAASGRNRCSKTLASRNFSHFGARYPGNQDPWGPGSTGNPPFGIRYGSVPRNNGLSRNQTGRNRPANTPAAKGGKPGVFRNKIPVFAPKKIF